MLKKIISLILVVCMLSALGVAVSAEGEQVIEVTATAIEDGAFCVDISIKNNILTTYEGSAPTNDDIKGLSAYQVNLTYDADLFEVYEPYALTEYDGDPTLNGTKAQWTSTSGLRLTEGSGKNKTYKYYEDATLLRYDVELNSNIPEEKLGETVRISLDTDFSFFANIDASKITIDPAYVDVVIPDTREEIAGLTATPVEGLAYTGEVIDPATTVTLNTVEGDVVTYKSEPAEIKNADTYKVTATVKRAGFKATAVSADVVIGKKDINVTMADASMTYGDPVPAFTSDAPADVTVTPVAIENPNAGTHAITATAEDTTGNYNVTVKAGTLTVNKKPIKVTMADASMTYGDPLPEFTSDAPAGVTIAPTVAEKPNAGTVEITATAESDNYDVTEVVSGTLTVNKKPLTITAQNEFQVQGNGLISEFKPAVVEWLVEGDEITNIVVGLKETYTDAEGDYVIEVKSYDDNANYEITTVEGVYSIKTAIPVNVVFGENKKTYGDDDAAVVVTVTKGDDTADASSLVTITRKANEAAGTYADAYEVVLNVETDEATGLPYALNISGNTYVIEARNVVIVPNYTKSYIGKDMEALSYKVYDADADGIATEVVNEKAYEEITNVELECAEFNNAAEATFDIEVKSYDANANYVIATTKGTYEVDKASGRPSQTGIIKPATGGATGGSTGGSTTKPEDDKKEDENTKAPSASIAIKENADEIKFIEGYEDKTFRPDVNATRNDVVAALTALFDITDVENAPTFTDTDDAAIKALAAAGVIDGYEDGSFKGYNDVTRAEFVKLLTAALKLEAVEGAEANFSDIDGHWAEEYIKTFVSKGYVVGYPDGTFRPDDNITRAEIVVVITRVVGTVDAEAAINFADVDETHWAYSYIKNAAK